MIAQGVTAFGHIPMQKCKNRQEDLHCSIVTHVRFRLPTQSNRFVHELLFYFNFMNHRHY